MPAASDMLAGIPQSARAPILLGGPTAIGKSEIATHLARIVDGEIISVDSMQVYRGLDIGTAKPSPGERAAVPHHLIDVCGLTEEFDAAKFRRLAGDSIRGIVSRNRVPILCGGTGLYFKAFLEGLGSAPPAVPAIRAELESMPSEARLRELEQLDPVAYSKIDRANPRRVIRALEVIRITGKPFSTQRANWASTTTDEASPPACANFFCFSRDTEDLRSRINVRVEAMFREGLVDETARLLQNGLTENRTAMQAIGYRQVVEHLRGERSLEATIELVKIRTRQFAKRQMTWFRRQSNPEWIALRPDSNPTQIAARIAGPVEGGKGC